MAISISLERLVLKVLLMNLKNIGIDKKLSQKIVNSVLTNMPVGMNLERQLNMPKKLNPKLKIAIISQSLRGLDYYTGLVFETKLPTHPEYGSVLSGGRYDNLIGTFSNKSIPAVGMSVGVDRLFSALQEFKLVPEIKTVTKVLVANFDENLGAKYSQIANILREEGINTEVLYEFSDLKKNLKYASDREIPSVIIVGSKESASGKVTLKNMKTGDQKEISIEEAIKMIKSNNG